MFFRIQTVVTTELLGGYSGSWSTNAAHMSKYSLLHVLSAKRTKSRSTQTQGQGICATAHPNWPCNSRLWKRLILSSCLSYHLLIHRAQMFPPHRCICSCASWTKMTGAFYLHTDEVPPPKGTRALIPWEGNPLLFGQLYVSQSGNWNNLPILSWGNKVQEFNLL